MTLTEIYNKALKEVEDAIDNAGYYDDVEGLEKERQELLKKLENLKEYSCYVVVIEETLSKRVCIKAKSLEEAKKVAEEKYHKAEEGFILGADDLDGVKFLGYYTENKKEGN